ncbi:ribonucleoside hydrolase RihC [Enterococcus rivorum]|uniref:Ribonucleoside hydrolase RihC n=1 Tax=Enterococcus rivorum TaxID=762845 RepID=A0A1E5L176_9ENTE|nr:ribonucleoside hydrolase RihC [Enterococcus rivorum]MBP2098566.1 non-specific riboncleoside hydrolase [Enterococcus rivorum]OEH83844.1 ribonucleoside hydrolase RihC [Enterococcus rivorum]
MIKEKTPIIIDTDPGIDDAVALSIALNHPKLDVLLLTTVAGNVNVNKTTENTLKLVSFFGKTVPVAKGCDKPLLIQLEDSAEIHGESGMDGFDFPAITEKTLAIHAVEAMKNCILNSPEPVTLVPIAALTNIALLVSMYPETKQNIKEIVMMGGSLSRGNTHTSAEFNTYVDPHAAQIVFQSDIPIVMVGLDVTSTAVLTKNEVEQIKEFGKVGNMFYSLFQHYRGGSLQTGLKMHDVCAIAYLTNPELFTVQKTFVEIALEGPAAGATVADLKMKYHNTTNAEVCLDIDIPAFQKWVVSNLESI